MKMTLSDGTKKSLFELTFDGPCTNYGGRHPHPPCSIRKFPPFGAVLPSCFSFYCNCHFANDIPLTSINLYTYTREKLLDIEPQELKFKFELGKRASCTLRLTNNSRNPVAFKVMTTNPQKYCVGTNIGIVSPGSSLMLQPTWSSFPVNSSFKASLVVLTMRSPKEVPTNMECKDKFSMKSVVTSPGATIEATRRLFNERGLVEECKLRVLYISPSLRQSSNFERSEAGSLQNATLQRGNLNDYELKARTMARGARGAALAPFAAYGAGLHKGAAMARLCEKGLGGWAVGSLDGPIK
ncbi:UNVERIFIED_CONTAM: Vesicle-associated protein 1-2 [Sesamum latifolium]|uniref:Vesicle-associated protein 1-2 n=1 Tax=Sesamum latifolium TaxID=2727402 RepID=A0AAW2SSY8_9LAMI